MRKRSYLTIIARATVSGVLLLTVVLALITYPLFDLAFAAAEKVSEATHLAIFVAKMRGMAVQAVFRTTRVT